MNYVVCENFCKLKVTLKDSDNHLPQRGSS